MSTLPDVSDLTVGILGGTGDQGRGLAYRFARAGLYGSWLRDQERSQLAGALCAGDNMPTAGPTDVSAFVPFLAPF